MRKPTLENKDRPPKFAPVGCVGILLGYRTHPGGKWRHEYQVVELPGFADLDLAYNTRPQEMSKIRVHIVQEVRLPEDGISFPMKKHYDWRNSTLEGIKSRNPPVPPPSDNVEPLIVAGPQADPDPDDVESDDDVGTSHFIADKRRKGADMPDLDDGMATPPAEVAEPDVRDLTGPLEMRSDSGVLPGGVEKNQPSKIHGDDTDSEYDIDKRGHKHRKDEFGQRIRKSGRPPFIPSAWWSTLSQK